MKNDGRYFEPNEAPDEVKNETKNRKIKIRFKTEDDVKEFIKRTGISLTPGKVNRIKLPIGNTLSQFF